MLALIACLAPIALGFGVPVVVLLRMTLAQGDGLLGAMFLELAFNSFSLAAIAAALITALALVVAYGLRLRPNPLIRASARVASMGYAIPGAVIAVGVLIPFARLDNTVDAWMRDALGISTGLILTGTIGGLLFAYLVRFLALALNSVEAGLAKITRNLDDAARRSAAGRRGAGAGARAPDVGQPAVGGDPGVRRCAEGAAGDLDPAAVRLRDPGDWIYRFASDERLAEASSAALAIVLVGLVPVILLSRAIACVRPRIVERAAAEPDPDGPASRGTIEARCGVLRQRASRAPYFQPARSISMTASALCSP